MPKIAELKKRLMSNPDFREEYEKADAEYSSIGKNIRSIHTEADYEWALAEIAKYFDNQPEPGTPEGERFDKLAALIEAYESSHEHDDL